MGSVGVSARAALAFCFAALALPAGAIGAFPGGNPAESPRANTPNDPDFDDCELDDAQGAPHCGSYFSEQYQLFGFSPDSANLLTGIPPLLHPANATPYVDCSQLDAQGKAANVAAGDPACAQIAGVRADTAWKYSTGDPETVIAILDTGIRWQERELVEQIHLNRDELPQPEADRAEPVGGGPDCAAFAAADDANSDGAFNVRDFACDSRVDPAGGDEEADDILDGSDLIAAFSDSTDADSNGYVDDIAGWDFFDDDNDPFDASSCCSASGHGTGRAEEAAARTDNGRSGAGICPECQIMPLRIWDSFVVPTDFHAMAVVYAADNGAQVVEGANGGLTNTRFARRAYEYADSRGLALMLVSSDINSANHNYPTNYTEAVYVAGSLPDTAPFEGCSGIGLPVIGDLIPIPPEAEDACNQLLGLLGPELTPSLQPPTTSFFRNANLTQYGGKADIVLMGATGSQNTGQASGAAGLLASFAREKLGQPLSGNEIRQLLTMTAEDVLPENTGALGLPDKANPGWDPHFGYGRVNLAAAMQRIAAGRIPPEAALDAPDWFTPINVDRVGPAGVKVHGRVAAPYSQAGVGAWELEYACGADALDSSFQPVPGASGHGPHDGLLGTLSESLLGSLADTCDGSVDAPDFGRPVGAASDGNAPGDPYPDPDPERHSFQIRLTVHDAGDPANIGRYRKTLFAYRNDGNLAGWPRPMGDGSDADARITGSGGEVPARLFDLDGDNALDVIQPTSSGEVFVLDSAGEPLQSWNGGQPVHTRPFAVAAAHGVPAGTGGVPRESPRAPAIGDLDGDLAPDVVLTAGERVYAWDRHGSPLAGFPVRVDPDLSVPCKPGAPEPCFNADDRAITPDNHIKRGFMGAPALADLDGDRRLDVVAGSLDQHVYAWDGEGQTLPGFPVKLESEGAPGAEIITTPAIAELDGKGPPEVVLATNEMIPGDPEFALPTSPFELFNLLLGSTTGSNPVYAIHGDGTPVAGWPAKVGVAAGDLLPLVLPSHDAAVLDSDRDGDDEVVVSAGTSLGVGGTRLVDGDASTLTAYASLAGDSLDPTLVFNAADYASIGALAGSDPSVIKGGLTLAAAANLLAANQNLPFTHVVQAWDADSETGAGLPGYPRATDDFQLLGQPAIANVGAGADRQALYGTGLYQLHAYGPAGAEPAGWPKFTGGWTQSTPSVGDADGDGDLEVTALTREGWSFLWETGTPACERDGTSTNAEWWTFHHDEHGTNNYGHDARPPGAPEGLRARRGGDGSIRGDWRAPGDDWLCGRADRYRLLLSRDRIREPLDGRAVSNEASAEPAARSARANPSSIPSGEPQEFAVTGDAASRARFVAVHYRDDAGNWGLLAQARVDGRRGGDGGGDDGDGPGGSGGSGAGGQGGNGDPGDAPGATGVGDEAESGGGLPFTGLSLIVLLVLGLAALLTGRFLRRPGGTG